MFVAQVKMIETYIPRMSVRDLQVTNYSFVNLHNIEERRELLVFVKGNMYCSDSQFMRANVKNKIEEGAVKILKKHGLYKKRKHPAILAVNTDSSIILICYISKNGSIISPESGYRSKEHPCYISDLPPLVGKCAIVYNKIGNLIRLYFIDRQNNSGYLRQALSLMKYRYDFHKPKTVTTTGLFLAMCVTAQRVYLEVPKVNSLQFLMNLIEKSNAFGHSEFSKNLNDGLFIQKILDNESESISTNGCEISLTDIVEHPEILENVDEATSIEIDINIEEMFAGCARIREIYVEDNLLVITIIPLISDTDQCTEIVTQILDKALDNLSFVVISHNDKEK